MIKQGPPMNGISYSRMQTQKRTNGQSIQCVRCNAISTLDPVRGLSSLRRRTKRNVEEIKDKCADHNPDFQMYCFDDCELICYLCAGGSHSRHNVEALDVAQKKIQVQLQTQMATLEQKRSKLETFTETVKKQREQINLASEKAHKDAKEKFEQLRKLIEEKEKEILETIKKTETSKLSTIQNELNKAQQRIEDVDKNITSVQEAMCEQTPLGFLQRYSNTEEQLRHSCVTADPEIKQKWFQMPTLNMQYGEQAIKMIKYKDKGPLPFGSYAPEDDDSYEEEDTYATEY